MFPKYLPSEFVTRKLYFLEKGTLYDENGRKSRINGYSDMRAFLFDAGAFCFVESLTNKKSFPYLTDAIHEIHDTVHCQKNGKATSITLRGGNQGNRKIIPIRTWRDRKDAVLDCNFLKYMRELYEYCGVGTQATQGAIGVALMRKIWKENKLNWHTSPGIICQEYLKDYGVGGRCDTMVGLYKDTGYIYPEVTELDMSSAYLAHYQIHPTGTACPFQGKSGARYYATFFCECTVTIHDTLPLGCFPKKEARFENITYPTLPGAYRTYLWREQIEDCLEAGCSIHIHQGYGWKATTCDNRPWARYLYLLRRGVYGEPFERDIKNAAVSGIGRHGMGYNFYSLSNEIKGKNDIVHLDDNDRETLFVVNQSTDYSQPGMGHWYSYTIMQCARTLYRLALPYAIEGRLIMTNYDALVITALDETHTYAEKHTEAAKMVEMGDLRWTRLTNVKILAPRSLECDQKVIRPGVLREERVA